jgi:hypothetical protein
MDIYYKKYIKYKTKYIKLRNLLGGSKKEKSIGTIEVVCNNDELINKPITKKIKDREYKYIRKSLQYPIYPKDYVNKDSRDKVFFHTFIKEARDKIFAVGNTEKLILSVDPGQPLLCFKLGNNGIQNIERAVTDKILDKITEKNASSREPYKFGINFQFLKPAKKP